MPRCTAVKGDGSPCRAWAVHGSDPPLCSAHGGGRGRVGAPHGNANAVSHGFYQAVDATTTVDEEELISLGDLIRKAQVRLEKLEAYLDEHGNLDPDQFVRLESLHSQAVSRLGRLVEKRQKLLGGEEDELMKAINIALDRAAEHLGIKV